MCNVLVFYCYTRGEKKFEKIKKIKVLRAEKRCRVMPKE